jgi:purine-nucleoside phosphorylase
MTKSELSQQTEETVAAIRRYSQLKPKVGMILGSGLGELVDAVKEGVSISYDKLPHIAVSTVRGHAGRFVLGYLSQQPVIVMQGRLHAYEGYTMGQTTFPVRVMRALGAEILIVTNAAGGINPSFQVGDVMRIVDHINMLGMTGRNPLWGPNDPNLGPRFLEMSNAYDPIIGALADSVAHSLGFELRNGVYVQLGGPSFETPAEIRFLQGIGGDAVGMSTAAEVIVARHGDMRVLGFSHISNIALGEQPPISSASPEDVHGEVLEAGQRAIPRLVALIQGVLERLDEV